MNPLSRVATGGHGDQSSSDRDGVHGAAHDAILADLLAELRGLRSDLQSAIACLSAQSNGRSAMEHDPAKLLTNADVACILGIDGRTFRSMRASGDAPMAIMIGTRPRWRRADVEAWIAKRGAQ